MTLHVWRKLASSKWADAWEERLRFLGPQRLALTSLPGGRSIRLEAYGVSAAEGRALVKAFGGALTILKDEAWQRPAPEMSRPLRIRGRLIIIHEPGATTPNAPPIPTLLIPGGMAFGTGEHATTASCLRFLADRSAALLRGAWTLLDLGTGTGILALAAVRLGAAGAEGIDFDPHAIRTAKANARVNGIRTATFHQADVLAWKPQLTHAVVTANLFSELLLEILPKIRRAMRPGGHVILSGILRKQEAGVVGALPAAGLSLLKLTRRGKWIALLAHRG